MQEAATAHHLDADSIPGQVAVDTTWLYAVGRLAYSRF